MGERVDGDHAGAGFPGDRLGVAATELRLHDDRVDTRLSRLPDQPAELANARRLAFPFDRQLGQAVAVGEISPGRVEDHEPARRQILQQRVDALVQRFQFGSQSAVAGLVVGAVGGVQLDQRIADIGGDPDRGDRTGPDMRVEFVVAMLVTVMRGRASTQPDALAGIDEANVGIALPHPRQPASLRRDTDVDEQPCPLQSRHLARRRGKGRRVLAGRDHRLDVDMGAADLFGQVSQRLDADEHLQWGGSGQCRGR